MNFDTTSKSGSVFLAVGLTQGLLLALLRYLFPQWESLGFTQAFICAAGFYFLFAYNAVRTARLSLTSVVLGLSAAMMWKWPLGGYDGTIFWMGCMAFYALNSLHQVHHQENTWQPTYLGLFNSVWNNFGLMLGAGLFVAMAWVVLGLWAGLFHLIGVDFFRDTFFSETFALFITPVMFVVGLQIMYKADKAVNFFLGILFGFCRIILPFLALISVLFLLSWTISRGRFAGAMADVLLDSLAFFVFFSIIVINGVYQDGSKSISNWYKKLVFVFLWTQLLFSLMSVYYFVSSNSQATIWSSIPLAVTTLLLALYALGYAVASVQHAPWLHSLQRINIVLAWVMIVVNIMMNNPLTYYGLPAAREPVAKAKAQQLTLEQTKLRWVERSQFKVAGGVVLGYANSQPLYACRARYHGNVQPGQLTQGRCVITDIGKSYVMPHYEVLTGVGRISWSQYFYGSERSPYAKAQQFTFRAGNDAGREIYICRTIYNNHIHVGKVVAGQCVVADGDKEAVVPLFEYLNAVVE